MQTHHVFNINKYLQYAGNQETLQASSPSQVYQECSAPYVALQPLNSHIHYCEPVSTCPGSATHAISQPHKLKLYTYQLLAK